MTFIIYIMRIMVATRYERSEVSMASQAASENVVRLETRQEPPQELELKGSSKRHGKRPSRAVIASAIALVAGGTGALWITAPASSQTTNDAYVDADSTTVAPKIRGLVEEVLVRDNQPVRAGDPLVLVDPEEFDAKVRAAKADLADASADVAAAQAALVSHDAEERLTVAQVSEAGTAIRAADAEAERADADRKRTDALAAEGFASRRTVDSFRSQAVGAEQAAARARASLAVSQKQAGLTGSKRDGLMADLQKAQARKLGAQAALDLALQDQRHALIRAPIDGVIGNRQVRVGDYVQPGTRLLTLVPVQAVYVTANFKETQVRTMRVGQPVRVKVDALGSPLTGHVDSFAPGSGSTFSLLPFEPGTGNFTKIVQRVPVRIRFDAGQAGLDQLRAGISATVTVNVRS
jgi:membrane fusion protein (multidrug efflux system)